MQTETVEVLFLTPVTFIGRMVCFVTGDFYSHSVVVVRGQVYSSQIPVVAKFPFEQANKQRYYQSPGKITVDLPKDSIDIMVKWLDSRVGQVYDILSIIGWIVCIKKLQWRGRFYCHEFCREVFEKAGHFEDIDELITARRLIDDLVELNSRITSSS